MKTMDARPRWSKGAKLLTLLTIVCACLAITSAPPWTALAQERQTTTAQDVQTPQVRDLPLGPIEQAEKDGTALHISLKDLTKLALQNNLDIAISDTNEALYQSRITQTYGYYDPTISLYLNAGRTKSANTNITNVSASGFNQRDAADWNFSYEQNVTSGGGFTVNFNSRRSDTNQLAALFTPQYSVASSIQFTQPLWRNRRIDQTRSNIQLTNLDLKTNDSKFKQSVTNTIASIQSLYWDLVGAIRDYDIKRQSVELARIQVDQNKLKVQIGTAAAINITEAMATQASREIDLIRSRQNILTTENSLRNMISKDRNADIWRQIIVPTDAPDFLEYKVGMDQAIQEAMKNRPELEQYEIQLQQNNISYQSQQNSKKWQFDVTGTFGSTGTAGPQSYTADGLPKIQPQFVGNILTAYKTMFTEGLTNWSVVFNVQIPVKSRSIDSQLAQTQIARQQLLMNRTKTEQNIIVQVRNAVELLETARQAVETARISRELAEQQLDGETKRLQAGMSQNFLVLQRQTDLAAAQGSELQALIGFRKAIINLQQNMYTLLEANDFEVAKTDGKSTPAFR